jgi:outer membrane protein assembly factor BamB
VLDSGRIIVGSLDGDLRALDANDGKLLWSLHDLPVELPLLRVGQQLILATTDRRLHAFDLVEQRRTTRELPDALAAGLLSHGSTIVAIGERPQAMAFSLPGLTPLWQQPIKGLGHPWAAITDRELIVADERGRIAALDLTNGNELWRRDLDLAVLDAPVVVGAEGVAVITTGVVLLLDRTTGQTKQQLPRLEQDWQGPAIAIGNRLFVPLREGPLQSIDAATFKPLYRIQAPRRSRFLSIGEKLLLVTPDHQLSTFARLR